jgi:hypothetical protein
VWGKRNNQPNNKWDKDDDDDAIIQSNKRQKKKTQFRIRLQELILILPKSRIPSRDEKIQFDLVTPAESKTICPNP